MPAKQASPFISLQHATSLALRGRTRMLAKPFVADVVPNRTKYGEIPKELLKEIMR